MDVGALITRAKIGSAMEVAAQKRVLDAMKTQGVALQEMLAASAAATGSVNSPSQGLHIDALA